MESKGHLGAAPTSSPLLSSQSSYQFCLFCVSLSPHRKIARGVYTIDFRSNQVRGVQDCIKTMHEAQDGPHHVARSVAHVVGPLASPVDFFFSISRVFQKNDVAENLGPFDIRKGLRKSKNMQKQGNLFRSVKI
jgi:hypothetical protein